MKRKLRMLGACLAAIGAVGAVGASGAGADFESEKSPTTWTVSANSAIEIGWNSGSAKLSCTGLQFDNTVMSGTTATKVVATPTITNCDNFLGVAITVDSNDCVYELTLADSTTTGTTDLECPGTGIQFTIGSICAYEFDPQTDLTSLSYRNQGSGTTREIEVLTNITNLDVTRTTNDFFCPAGGTVAGGNAGQITGSFTLTGENAAGTEHIGIWVD